MKKVILILLGAVLLAFAAASSAKADCDTPPPTDPTGFE